MPSNRDYGKAEVARTTFMLSKVWENHRDLTKAEKCKNDAEAIRKEILRERFLPVVDLESYDSLIGL
jgi:hypothetical protein